MSLTVNEIFYSIQGESLLCGRPCVFVRLTGCNLRCSYCDTRYAYKEGVKMTIDQIREQVATYACRLIEVTGGEPLLQAETPRLILELLKSGYEVMMETNGSLDITDVDHRCIKVVDVKCPTSGESGKNDLNNFERLNPSDQVKFVIGNRMDYDYAKEIIAANEVGLPMSQVLFSPVSGVMAPARLAKWILDDHLDVRLNLPLHKVIWPNRNRGF